VIQLYDTALHHYFTENVKGEVAIVPVKDYWNVTAMHRENRLQLPAIVLFRTNWTPERQLQSWPIARKGRIDRVQEHKKISEQAIPVQVDYTVTLLATTQDDIDELTSEMTFLFLNKPRLTVLLPYGSDRSIHGQIMINGDFQNSSGNDQFSVTGILYQQIIPIRVLGANIIDIRRKNLRYLEWSIDSNLYNNVKEEIEDAEN
jgi:hypothetical protein